MLGRVSKYSVPMTIITTSCWLSLECKYKNLRRALWLLQKGALWWSKEIIKEEENERKRQKREVRDEAGMCPTVERWMTEGVSLWVGTSASHTPHSHHLFPSWPHTALHTRHSGSLFAQTEAPLALLHSYCLQHTDNKWGVLSRKAVQILVFFHTTQLSKTKVVEVGQPVFLLDICFSAYWCKTKTELESYTTH